MGRLPAYLCPFNACDGSGWSVDETTRLATRCQCMNERIALRNRHDTERRQAAAASAARSDQEESAW
jgi:hypothetical protein